MTLFCHVIMSNCTSSESENTTNTTNTLDAPTESLVLITSSSTTTDSNEIPQIDMKSRFQEYKTSLNTVQDDAKNKFHKETKGLLKESEEKTKEPVPCTCGVFLSGQFKKGSKDQPKGVPVLTQETDTPFMNNAVGNRQCTNKCLELVRIFYKFL